jgi:carbamoyltransferase
MAGVMRFVLGISAYYHDAAAALLDRGDIVAAAQEERFSRRKNDERFPRAAVEFCLRQARIRAGELDAVVFYDKPVVKFARVLETFLSIAPRGLKTFVRALPPWLGEKLNLRQTIREEIPGLSEECPILFSAHHQAHAASAFYPSPFEEAAIVTVDGVGEYATTTIGQGKGKKIELLQEIRFPHSLGLLYSAITAYCGFRVNSGEYKLMGLAPYGEPAYVQRILDELLDLKQDGSFWLNLDYFDFLEGERMTSGKFHELFGGPPRSPEAPLEQRHLDLAASIQKVTEEAMLRLARQARQTTGLKRLCLAGGVALNCVANGSILREKLFEQLWIQPAAGDAGGALGAALALWHGQPGVERTAAPADSMKGAFLGPEFSDREIEETLERISAVYQRVEEPVLLDQAARWLAEEKVVGWFQGRMEFGPRALGNRSILGDPRSPRMQSVMNLKIKFRESFRPFAPVVKRERARDFFELETDSPYMLLVAPVREPLRVNQGEARKGLERIHETRSQLPAVTHVDFSARVQTVSEWQNKRLHALLDRFEAITGCPVLVNTSFNVRGEPVVCTPEDACRCFFNTEMDGLVLGNFLLEKSRQTARPLPHKEELTD